MKSITECCKYYLMLFCVTSSCSYSSPRRWCTE